MCMLAAVVTNAGYSLRRDVTSLGAMQGARSGSRGGGDEQAVRLCYAEPPRDTLGERLTGKLFSAGLETAKLARMER